MGLGTNWVNLPGLISGNAYTGAKGAQAWSDMGCTGGLPLSSDKSHFDEGCLVHELMTPTLKFGESVIVSPITMGCLEDLGFQVNRNEQEEYGLSDLGNCGNACPAAARRTLGFLPRHSNSTTALRPGLRGREKLNRKPLSDQGEWEIVQAAVERFRKRPKPVSSLNATARHSHRATKRTTGVFENMENFDHRVISYLYEEDGEYYSRVVHRSQVEHLI